MFSSAQAHDASYSRLLSPAQLGPLQLENRIVLPAMDMNMCENGIITNAEIAHYQARAAGGAGLLITGSGAVAFPIGATSSKQPGLSDERFLPGLAKLADAVHAEGSRLCIQLCHHGKAARLDMAEDRPVLVASIPLDHPDMSALADCTPTELGRLGAVTGGKLPEYREATGDDLAWVVDQFANAARLVQRAGADAVEIHAAHGYLLSGFLSPADNHRDDEWGGSQAGRSRLLGDVTAAIRKAVGSSMAVIVRLNGQEYGDDKRTTLDHSIDAARRAAAAGADAIHVSGYGRNSFANFTDGPLPDTLAAYRSDAAAINAAVDIPVIAVGRIDPSAGESMLAAGDCDFVSMGRQLLADPDLPRKLAVGQQPSIRPCINCYVCVEENFFDDPPRCAVNPGLCGEVTEPDSATTPKRVLVVGGGPAGLETARLAAASGHHVILVEASDKLGGTAWFSQLTSPENGQLVEWLSRQVHDAGVDIRLSTRATAESIRSLTPDAVVIATGATRGLPDVPGADLAHVRDGDGLRALVLGEAVAEQPLLLRVLSKLGRLLRITTNPDRIRSVTRRWMPLGRNVVVIGGSLVGIELAEFLAERGRTVTVLESGSQLGLPMAMPRRWTAVRRAASHGVVLARGAVLLEITDTEVVWENRGEQHRAPADDVIIASEVTPSTALADELADSGFDVHTVGDAGEIGYIHGAMHTAWVVAGRL